MENEKDLSGGLFCCQETGLDLYDVLHGYEIRQLICYI